MVIYCGGVCLQVGSAPVAGAIIAARSWCSANPGLSRGGVAAHSRCFAAPALGRGGVTGLSSAVRIASDGRLSD